MDTPSYQIKENLLTIVIIIGFAILLGFFALNFVSTVEQASKKTGIQVNQTVNTATLNVTNAISQMVDLQANLSTLLTEERETSKKNLELFLETFANQSESEVNATVHLEDTVVETLASSQNLTRESMSALQERNQLLSTQIIQFNEIIRLLGGNVQDGSINVTLPLTPNATVSQQQ